MQNGMSFFTGLVPVISIGKMRRFSSSGWSGQARP
jgi:hypothetical protein